MSQLPQGWSEVRLDSISKIVTGKTPSKKDKDNFGGNIPFIKPGDILNQGYINSTVETITEKGAELVPSIPKDSITVTCIGNLGRVAITKEKSATNQQINTVIPNEKVEPKYLFHYLRTIREWMENEASATTVAIINKTKFSAAPIRLPSSKADQKRIADKLDSVLAKVEAAQARLDKIPTILKRFRQSVLAAATSGELTKDWRENNNYLASEMLGAHIPPKKPARYKSRNMGNIMGVNATAVGKPSEKLVPNWEWTPMVDIAEMSSGHTPSRSKPEYWGGDICWIGIKDARSSHSSTIEDTDQKTNELGLANSAARLIPKDTICISRTASVGYVIKLGREMATSQDFVNWTPTKVVNADWLKWLFVAEKEALFKFGRGTTHTTVYFPEWLSIHVLLPHIEEQKEIVSRIDSLMAHADTVEKQYHAAKVHLDKLTQSILAKAFRGELLLSEVDTEVDAALQAAETVAVQDGKEKQ